MVEIIEGVEEKKIPFPNLPRSIWAIIIPWVIILLILYFDVAAQADAGGTGITTNPVIFFTIPLLFLIVFLPKRGFATIMQSLGLHMPDFKHKVLALIAGLGGASVGIIGNYFLTNAGIIPLYFASFAIGMTLSSAIIYHGVVAVFEESYSVMFIKIAANNTSKYGIKGFAGLIGGIMIGRAFWASLHWFAYGGWLGVQALPLFFIAWTMGVIFSLLSVFFGQTVGQAYFSIPAITAHWSFNVAVQINLSLLPLAAVLVFI